MQENGRLTTCDRCGAQVFSRATGEGELDGGFTRWNKFEALPQGWGFRGKKCLMLCPVCGGEWDKMEEAFFTL